MLHLCCIITSNVFPVELVQNPGILFGALYREVLCYAVSETRLQQRRGNMSGALLILPTSWIYGAATPRLDLFLKVHLYCDICN